MKYDFILFENTRNTDNHYKDLAIFSQMLKDCGYSVAIVDLFKEDQLCITPGIPHITPKVKCGDSLRQRFRPKTPIHKLIHIRKTENYLSAVFEEIKDLSDNFYLGSLFLDFPINFAKKLPADKKYFIWGLRSNVMTPDYFKSISLSRLLSIRLWKLLLQTKNIYLIVSDELIEKEFVEQGIEKKRIIMRPERTVSALIPIKTRKAETSLNLLSIGTLRAKKKVYKCIAALAILQDSDITYTIAGKSKLKSLDILIEEKSRNMANVVRKNYIIPDNEYEQLISDCDYLVICDDNKGVVATSGTMNEAILAGRPIIAPNEPSFSHYLEKYPMGILYDLHDIQSLAEAIKKAKSTDFSIYRTPMQKYQETLLYDNVVVTLKNTMAKIIKTN